MFEIYCVLTGALIVFFGFTAYRQSRDALHPAIVLSPLFLFMNAVWPILLSRDGGLTVFLSEEALEKTALLYLITLTFFYCGLIHRARVPARIRRGGHGLIRFAPTALQRERLYAVSILFGLLSVVAFWYMLGNAGGFAEAYGRVKGGGHASSGYVGEATLLSYPAILFLALSKRGTRRLSLGIVALALLFASPHLLQGTFGGRRGPLFMVLTVLFFAWHVAKPTKLSIKRTLLAIGTIGLLVIAVWSQRQIVYLGSEGEIESGRIAEILAPDSVDTGNTYVNSGLAISTVDYFGDYYWGYRYFVTLVIRPIPKQLWPTKYEDMGADWLYRYGDDQRSQEYIEATGVAWIAGSAMPAIADGYLEFSWGVVILFYVTGRLFSYAWRRRIERRGLWEVIYLVMVILGIYLATQSYSAWAHRLMFIGIPTVLVWRYWIMPATVVAIDAAHRNAGRRQ